MQVTCFGVDWKEIEKRPDLQEIVDEMLNADDIDLYAKNLPNGIWKSDSAMEYFNVASALEAYIKIAEEKDRVGIEQLSNYLISESDSLRDEIGLIPLTEGCYFISSSPNRVNNINKAFSSLDLKKISIGCASHCKLDSSEILMYLEQWQKAINYFSSQGLGMIGHCG